MWSSGDLWWQQGLPARLSARVGAAWVGREGRWLWRGLLLRLSWGGSGVCVYGGELQPCWAPFQTCCLLWVSWNDNMTLEYQLLSWSLIKLWVPALSLASSGIPGMGEIIQHVVVIIEYCNRVTCPFPVCWSLIWYSLRLKGSDGYTLKLIPLSVSSQKPAESFGHQRGPGKGQDPACGIAIQAGRATYDSSSALRQPWPWAGAGAHPYSTPHSAWTLWRPCFPRTGVKVSPRFCILTGFVVWLPASGNPTLGSPQASADI